MKLLRGYLQPSVLKKRHLLLKDDIAALIASERERKLGAQEAASNSSNLPASVRRARESRRGDTPVSLRIYSRPRLVIVGHVGT